MTRNAKSCTCQSSSASRGSGYQISVDLDVPALQSLFMLLSPLRLAELDQRAPVHPQSSSMEGRLATVPELSIAGFTAPCPPRHVYRDLIRSVVVSGRRNRQTLSSSSQSAHTGSSYSSDSGALDSCPPNNSGCFSSSASASAADFFDAYELRKIAHQMAIDGYTQRIVQAFDKASPVPASGYRGGPDRALENWFFELDVDWIVQFHSVHGFQLHLQDKSALWLQDLIEGWVRALSIIVFSMTEVVFATYEMIAVARFGKAIIAKMLVFVDVFLAALRAENLQAMLDMFICISRSSYMFKLLRFPAPSEAEWIFRETSDLLWSQVNRLNEAISSKMEEMRTLMEHDNDDWWAKQIKRGGGEVHRHTRLMVDCIVSMKNVRSSIENYAPIDKQPVTLGLLLSNTISYLKDLLSRKSELCSDPSLKYLFLLNNFHFMAQVCEPSNHWELVLTPECEKYMDSYLDASWGHVLSCIPKSNCPGLLRLWSNTPPLARFDSVFRKTYRAQKFWKVPDPRLRDWLRKTITERVISGYRNYLKEHTDSEKQVSGGSNSPDVLAEMLREIFEG